MKSILTLMTCLIMAISVVGQMSLSLEEARSLALEKNTRSQVAKMEIDKARSVVKETLAIGLPQVNASGSFNNFLDIPVQVIPDFISPAVYGVLLEEDLIDDGSVPTPGNVEAQFGTEYTMTGGVSLSQLIFNGSYLIGLQAARSYADLSKLEYERTELDVKQAVDQAYYTVLMAEENEQVLRESLENLEAMLKETEALYEEGFVEEQDTEQLRITVNTVGSDFNNASRQVILTRQLLNLQLGIPLNELVQLTDDSESILDFQSLPEELLTSSPDLSGHPEAKVMDQNVLLQQMRIREQKSRYLPVLNGFFNYQRQALRNDFDFFESGGEWFPSTVWGVELSVPIFSSGMKHQKVKQLEIDLQELELFRADTQKGLALSAERAASDYRFAKENFEIAEENLALAERIREKTRIKYQEGISSSFELDQIENQYLQAEGQRINATLSLLNALTEFKKAYNAF